MSYSKKTANYNLPQWEPNDKPSMRDYNEAFTAVDSQLANKANLSVLGATSWDSGNFPIESGTWEPTITGANGGSPSGYTIRSGTYMRMGNIVMARFDIAISGVGDLSGQLQITGIPFAAQSGSLFFVGVAGVGYGGLSSGLFGVTGGLGGLGGNIINLYKAYSNGGTVSLFGVDITDKFAPFGHVVYNIT
ncbi:hypothetical protein U6B65_13330 [Oscillospiraceae bacterium MB08-C2-2]|nr:hypothetical protein U6B65_13330 [Oscillospiraceae bacterium MB08-C2-2]